MKKCCSTPMNDTGPTANPPKKQSVPVGKSHLSGTLKNINKQNYTQNSSAEKIIINLFFQYKNVFLPYETFFKNDFKKRKRKRKQKIRNAPQVPRKS
jgi:hypothetical protein